jgi:hypothetical protein
VFSDPSNLPPPGAAGDGVLLYGTRSGSFDTILPPGPGLWWEPDYADDAGSLAVTLRGVAG